MRPRIIGMNADMCNVPSTVSIAARHRLPNGNTFLRPVKRRANQQVAQQSLRLAVNMLTCKNKASVTCMIFQARADAAPEALAGRRVCTVVVRPHRREIDESGMFRVHRGQQVVFQHALIEVEIFRLRLTQPQPFG